MRTDLVPLWLRAHEKIDLYLFLIEEHAKRRPGHHPSRGQIDIYAAKKLKRIGRHLSRLHAVYERAVNKES